MIKKTGFVITMLLVSVMAFAQDENEFITIFDFENEQPPTISADWNHIFDFTFEGEPTHSGDFSLILDIGDTTAPWRFSTWNFPEDIGTVDLSGTDQMEIWVYSDDGPFQMNWEFGGLNLGYRFYEEGDLGTWKRLSWWYTPENAEGFSAINSWGSFINPAAMNGFPEGFTGIIYMDDIRARVRTETPEREFLLINGFNTEDDLINVTVTEDYQADGIITDGAIDAPEGNGYLSFLLSNANDLRFSIDLSAYPEVVQYDRLHFDIYMDGVAAEGWGNFALNLVASAVDENGELILDEEGNVSTINTNVLGGSYVTAAQQQWRSFSVQLGPVEGTDGFLLQDLKETVIDPAYAADGGFISLDMTTNGGGVDGVVMYLDNLRLSRPVGTPVNQWSLY